MPLADENDLNDKLNERSSTASIKLVSNFQFNPSSSKGKITSISSNSVENTSPYSSQAIESTVTLPTSSSTLVKQKEALNDLFIKSIESIQSDSPREEDDNLQLSIESHKSNGKVVKVIPGKRVKLRCKVNSKPSSVIFNWSPIDSNVDIAKLTANSYSNLTYGISSQFFNNNNSSTYNQQQQMKTIAHSSGFSFSDVKSRDEGTQSELTFIPIESRKKQSQLACWANNDIGHQKNPCIFTIVTLGK